MSKPLNTCRTCRHRKSRLVAGAPSGHSGWNHYCGHPEYRKDGSRVSLWCFNNKPNRCLPVTGASDCPGHARDTAAAKEDA